MKSKFQCLYVQFDWNTDKLMLQQSGVVNTKTSGSAQLKIFSIWHFTGSLPTPGLEYKIVKF